MTVFGAVPANFPGHDVVLALSGLLVIPSAWLLVKSWHNERGLHADAEVAHTPWGRRIWRAWVRVLPLSAFIMIVGIPAALLGEFAPSESIVAYIGIGIDGGIVPPLMLGVITVALFNRPKFLVPPHLRTQPGVVGELRGQKPTPTPPPSQDPWIKLEEEVAREARNRPPVRLSWLPEDLRERHERELEGGPEHEGDPQQGRPGSR